MSTPEEGAVPFTPAEGGGSPKEGLEPFPDRLGRPG